MNQFVADNAVQSVIDWGCGDGNQLSLAEYPAYLGVDVSHRAVAICRTRFQDDSTKRFLALSEYRNETAELALSLDVIFHLVEDAVFESYMSNLFDSAQRYVIIYSSNTDDNDFCKSSTPIYLKIGKVFNS